MVEVCA
jgi:hypothetical protein